MLQFGFGSGLIYPKRTDLTGQGVLPFGAFQELSMDYTADIKQMYGPFQYPLDVARGKSKIECKAKFGQLSVALFNAFYFGGNIVTGQLLNAFQEAATIAATVTLNTSGSTASGATLPFTSTTGVQVGQSVSGTNIAAGSYVISLVANTSVTLNQAITGTVGSAAAIVFGPTATVANSMTYSADGGVKFGDTGTPLVYVVGGPTTGQYSLGPTGSYNFAAADTGRPVLIDYQYTATTGFKLVMSNPLMGSIPRFGITFVNYYEGNTYTLQLPTCASSKFSDPSKLDDYTMSELDFEAYANAAGNVGTITGSS